MKDFCSRYHIHDVRRELECVPNLMWLVERDWDEEHPEDRKEIVGIEEDGKEVDVWGNNVCNEGVWREEDEVSEMTEWDRLSRERDLDDCLKGKTR